MSHEQLINLFISKGKKTLYIKKDKHDFSNSNYPSTGFRPNITGMRKNYWGKNAFIALQAGYAYKIN